MLTISCKMRSWLRRNAATVAAQLGYTGEGAIMQLRTAMEANDPALLELWEAGKVISIRTT